MIDLLMHPWAALALAVALWIDDAATAAMMGRVRPDTQPAAAVPTEVRP